MKKFTVTAATGRSVPVPSSVLRAPTGAQVVLLATAPAGRSAHPSAWSHRRRTVRDDGR